MQIDATSNLRPLPEPERRVSPLPTNGRDAATFAASDSLERKLSETPDVRAEAVAMARTLINQTSYPPDVTIRGIATLLASSLDSTNE
jgi:hypothetical protein